MKSRRAVNTKSDRTKDAGGAIQLLHVRAGGRMGDRPIPDSFVKREEYVGVENGIPKEGAARMDGETAALYGT